MGKIVLEYDVASGQIIDATGACVGNWIGAVGFPEGNNTTAAPRDRADRIAQLKSLGYDIDEIIRLADHGLL